MYGQTRLLSSSSSIHVFDVFLQRLSKEILFGIETSLNILGVTSRVPAMSHSNSDKFRRELTLEVGLNQKECF